MSSVTENPFYQNSPQQTATATASDDKIYANESTFLISQDGKPEETSFVKRHFKHLIVLGVGLIFLTVILSVVVPYSLKALMGKYIKETQIEVEEMEITNIENGVASIRLAAYFKIDAPIEVSGFTEEANFTLLIADPLDRSKLDVIGIITLPSIEATGLVTFINISTVMYLESDRLFHEFISEVLENATVTAYFEGDLTITANIPVYGGIKTSEHLFTSASMLGMNGLDFELLRMDLYETSNDTVSLLFDLIIKNPSQFYSSYVLPLYNTNIRLYFNDTFIGLLEPQDLYIGKGDSPNVAIGHLQRTPFNEPAIAQFLSDYIMGFDVPVFVNGSTKIDIGLEKSPYYPARIIVHWTLPGLEDDLIQELWADEIKPPIRPPIKLTVEGLMYNPLDFGIEILEVEFDGYVGDPCNRTVSHILETYYDKPLQILSKSPTCVPLNLVLSLEDATCVLSASGSEAGLVLYALNGSLVIRLDQFEIKVSFEYGPIYGDFGQCIEPTAAPTSKSTSASPFRR